MSKICFAQLLWSVQGETHKGKSSKLLPLLRKNWRLLHRLLSWLPYLFITCCLIWVDSDESTLSLFGNRLGTNKSRWCGLSVFSELYNREGMVSPQWFVPAAMVSLPSVKAKVKSQTSCVMDLMLLVQNTRPMSKLSLWGSDEKSHRATSERIHPSQLALLALIGELSRMLEKLKKEDFTHEHEVRHMLWSRHK